MILRPARILRGLARIHGLCAGMERSQQVVAAIASYGSLNLIQGQALSGLMTHAVTPAADAPDLQDQEQPASERSAEQPAPPPAVNLAASNANLTPASMSALIQAQASLSQNAPAMIRQHTAQKLGEMIWKLDAAPALSPAPFAARQLQAARAALSQSLVDLRA
jgi:hypothetical protein